MPTYRIVVQTKVSPGAKFRSPRSTPLGDTETIEIVSTSLTTALLKAGIQFGRENRSPRIVSAEELLELDTSEITDADITHALTVGYETLEPNDYAGLNLYDQNDFEWTVNKVVEALRENGLVPGLNLSILMNPEGYCDYTMVEIRDSASNTYRSVGRDPKRLMNDRSLTGWDGILSIARALIEVVAVEKLL
ncbi:hypothetical protein [Cryobacterium zhongshanensis]|uniref:Uncharacterized protein n=1 Tax=Cryobacterium zhongshanensis TaxID=2928153 RepID=A0AA41QYT3_9MICO|nr:hypothetical protein [Cryobacterium zhongshanensis]MCI4659624.1 hypothetical protein [Cryobacterium zhongshanensis]